MDSKTAKQQMTIKTFAEEFDLSIPTLRRLIHIEGFPAYKLGGMWYIDVAEYRKWRDIQSRLNA